MSEVVGVRGGRFVVGRRTQSDEGEGRIGGSRRDLGDGRNGGIRGKREGIRLDAGFGEERGQLAARVFGVCAGGSDLAKAAELSTYAMTKLNNDRPVNMEVMLRLCKVFHCDIGDLMEVIEED